MTGFEGFLVLDKPQGVTSFSMVSMMRRLTGVRRIGHAGTLDPLATGVLPIAIGRATRILEYLDDDAKTYLARVRFGETTDTYDADGQVTSRADASRLEAGQLDAALQEFAGELTQAPPPYSAIKVAGKPLYRYARAGEDVPLTPRVVRIDAVRLLGYEPDRAEAEFVVECGKGTYIRSLAHDVGQRLGCGAHLTALRRARSGGFGIDEAHTVETVEAAAAEGWLDDLLLAADRPVERRPAAVFGSARLANVLAGRDVRTDRASEAELCRAYSADGTFLGLLRNLGGGTWHPEKVLATG